MFKKLAFFSLLATLSIGYVQAGETGFNLHQKDTTDILKKDTLINLVNVPTDPKQGFRDLFLAAPATGGSVSIGQLNPLAIGFVEDYMVKFGKSMDDMKDWGKPYFDMMDAVLIQHGLPKELKYLAVIESQLKSQARSWAGAVGPWQFMAGTARVMGLRVSRKVDERRDIVKSTHAASRYLNNLFEIYGDWLLVIAAYNGGPGKVNSAIKRSGSRDFWVLQKYLPTESRNHVKKFIATHYMMEGVGGVTTLTKSEAGLLAAAVASTATNNTLDSARSQAITGRYHSAIIVKHILMDITSFNKINPDFDKIIANNGEYPLRLPADKMDLFLSRKPMILAESLQLLLSPDISKTN